MSAELGQDRERISEAHRRLDRHETRIQSLETADAVSNERWASVEKSLEKIQSNTSWLTRLIIGSIITGIIAFIIAGGLNNGQ